MSSHLSTEHSFLAPTPEMHAIASAPDTTLLRHWLLADWPTAVRDVYLTTVVYDPVMECAVVRFTVEGETWTARAWETHPYRRTWEVRAPSPEHWRHGLANDLPTMITALASKYRAALATEAASIEARAAALTASRNALWQWPAEREIHPYQMRWYVGADGAGQSLFDSGWNGQHALAAGGRLELAGRRPIYLLSTHLPVFEEYRLRTRRFCQMSYANHPVPATATPSATSRSRGSNNWLSVKVPDTLIIHEPAPDYTDLWERKPGKRHIASDSTTQYGNTGPILSVVLLVQQRPTAA